MMYEIINPSDKAIFEAPDDAVAFVAMVLLGNGQYGCRREDGNDVPSLLLFANDEQRAAAAARAGVGTAGDLSERLAECMETRRLEVAAALESITYCSMDEFRSLNAAFEGLPDKAERLAKFNDQRRTSLNDIGGRAVSLAKHLRKREAMAKGASAAVANGAGDGDV